MIELTNKLQKPQDGDKGSTFFDNLEYNITQLDAHDHSGVTGGFYKGANLNSAALSLTTQSIAATWSAVSGHEGLYSQRITMPTGFTITAGRYIFFKHAVTGHPLMLSVEQVSTTEYDVFINDNTATLTAIYV